MDIICPTCKMKIQDNQVKRCPRCYTALNVMKKCEDCEGCSIFKSSGKDKSEGSTCSSHQ